MIVNTAKFSQRNGWVKFSPVVSNKCLRFEIFDNNEVIPLHSTTKGNTVSNYQAPDGSNSAPAATSDKSYLTTVLLSVLLGAVGADRFYLGQVGMGILKLVTCGGFGVWALIDSIMAATGARTDSQGRTLAGFPEQKKTGLIILIVAYGLGIISAIINSITMNSLGN